jgi:hypothetical protein
MFLKRFLVLLVLLFSTLPPSACGLLLALVTIPEVSRQNKPITHRGQIVDSNGNPINGVKVRVEYSHANWNPIWNMDYSTEKKDFVTNGSYFFTIKRSDANYTRIRFEKKGYHTFEMLESFDAMCFEVPFEQIRSDRGGFTLSDKSFEWDQSFKPGDLLRVTLQPDSEPRQPKLPTIVEKRTPPPGKER